MKALRIMALAGALVALGAPAAHAQGGGGGGQNRGARMMEMLMKDITLTDAQKAKVDSITTAYRAQMPQMGGGQMDDAARAKMREMREKQNADIRAVLTDDQKKTFDKNVEEMRNRPRPQGS
jgi:Spy/CpxP family protein refolding chaperone